MILAIFFFILFLVYFDIFCSSAHQRPQGGRRAFFFCELHKLRIQGRIQIFDKKLVFLVHFRPWDLSRKMRREISIDFSSGIIDFENKNTSIVQKRWTFRILVPRYSVLGVYFASSPDIYPHHVNFLTWMSLASLSVLYTYIIEYMEIEKTRFYYH